jgi:hypothetical protein
MTYIESIDVMTKGEIKSTSPVFHRNVLNVELLKQIAVIQTPLNSTSNFHPLNSTSNFHQSKQVDGGKVGAIS